MIAAVVFDMDGVLVDTESAWDEARRAVAAEAGRPWPDGATEAMMGMSSHEWSRYLRDDVGVDDDPQAISDAVVAALATTLRDHLPTLPRARDTVSAVADRWPIALASSANRPIIDLVLDELGVADRFAATVSSEEVGRGKPAPDVYLEAARRLHVEPRQAAAIEDSANGLRSAHAAGLQVVAFPSRAFPPDPQALDGTVATIGALDELLPVLSDL